MDWPKVLPKDDGIRPAGPSDRCFYCHRQIGEEHKRDCVTIKKKAIIQFTVEVEVEVPYDWNAQDVEFKYNKSSWCGSNIEGVIYGAVRKAESTAGCLCGSVKAKCVMLPENQTPIQDPEFTGERH